MAAGNALGAPLGADAEDADSHQGGHKKKKGKRGKEEGRISLCSKISNLDMSSTTIGRTDSGDDKSYSPESTAGACARKYMRVWELGSCSATRHTKLVNQP
jgi:hypothetical protein